MKSNIISAALIVLLMVIAGPAWSAGVMVEARAGYFSPQDAVFRQVYKHGPAYGSEITVTLTRGLGFWFGAEVFTKKGLTTFTQEATKIQLIPIYGGLKYEFGARAWVVKPYLGAAVGYFRYQEESVIGSASSGAVGFVGQAGLLFRAFAPLHFDLYFRYSSCRVTPSGETESTQIGGYQGGAGIAFRF